MAGGGMGRLEIGEVVDLALFSVTRLAGIFAFFEIEE
jgi:hypothetical protein